MTIPVYWHCPNGHVLGHVETSKNRPRLVLYRQAREGDGGEVIPGAAVLIGSATVTCSICGAVRAWHYADEKAAARLFQRRSPE